VIYRWTSFFKCRLYRVAFASMWYELGSDISTLPETYVYFLCHRIHWRTEAIKKEYWQFKLNSFRMSIFLIELTRSEEDL
jgi:hypothetical protein